MKGFGVGFLLLLAAVVCQAEIHERPGVAYAYQYRTDRISPVAIVTPAPVLLRPVVPVQSHLHLLYGAVPNRSAATVKPPTLQFPTRRPVAAAALDRLHTRVDIRRQERHREAHQHSGARPVIATPAVLVHTVPAPASTIVSHSHTEVYRKYH